MGADGSASTSSRRKERRLAVGLRISDGRVKGPSVHNLTLKWRPKRWRALVAGWDDTILLVSGRSSECDGATDTEVA